jgi:hypothetical protein
MPKKHPIVDPDAAVVALNNLVDTINATGGVTPKYDDLPLEENTPTPATDEDWIDLATAYALACRALGLPMRWAGDEEGTRSTEPTEVLAEGHSGAEPSAAELEALEAKAQELGLAPSDLDDVVHDIASGVASSINNQGLYEQIAYWAKEGWATVDVIEQELEKTAQEKHKSRSSGAAIAGANRDKRQ